jgi:hypothetical protein
MEISGLGPRDMPLSPFDISLMAWSVHTLEVLGGMSVCAITPYGNVSLVCTDFLCFLLSGRHSSLGCDDCKNTDQL